MKHTAFHTGKWSETRWIEEEITTRGADCCLKNKNAKSQLPLNVKISVVTSLDGINGE